MYKVITFFSCVLKHNLTQAGTELPTGQFQHKMMATEACTGRLQVENASGDDSGLKKAANPHTGGERWNILRMIYSLELGVRFRSLLAFCAMLKTWPFSQT